MQALVDVVRKPRPFPIMLPTSCAISWTQSGGLALHVPTSYCTPSTFVSVSPRQKLSATIMCAFQTQNHVVDALNTGLIRAAR